MKKTAISLLCLLLFPAVASAEPEFFFSPEASAATYQVSSAAVSIGYVVQLLFSLAVVLGFLYITAKYLLPKLKTSNKSEHITLFDRLVVEPQVTLYIVRSAGKSWLLSVSNKNVTVIDKFEEGTF